MAEVLDPRAVGLDDRGHALVPVTLIRLREWVVRAEGAGRVVVIDPDVTGYPEPARWLLLHTPAHGYAYDRAAIREPLAICTHDPRCGPTEKEVTPCE